MKTLSSTSSFLRRALSTAFAYVVPLSAAGCGDPGDGASANGKIQIDSLTSDVGRVYGQSAGGPPPEGTVTFYAFVRESPSRQWVDSTGNAARGRTIPGGRIGGGLLTDDAGHTYAIFQQTGSIYTATLTWSQIHRVHPIDAVRPGVVRRFVAKFYDASTSVHDDGNVATKSIDILLTCSNELDICNGVCKECCTEPSEPVATNR